MTLTGRLWRLRGYHLVFYRQQSLWVVPYQGDLLLHITAISKKKVPYFCWWLAAKGLLWNGSFTRQGCANAHQAERDRHVPRFGLLLKSMGKLQSASFDSYDWRLLFVRKLSLYFMSFVPHLGCSINEEVWFDRLYIGREVTSSEVAPPLLGRLALLVKHIQTLQYEDRRFHFLLSGCKGVSMPWLLKIQTKEWYVLLFSAYSK